MAKKAQTTSGKQTKADKHHKRTLREVQAAGGEEEHVSLWRYFWRGFFLPLRMLGRGIAWLSHRPPLKQIGHGLRWFFTRKPMRFIAKWTGIKYIVDSWKELKDVTWPSFKESIRLTGAVIIFSVIFGVLIAIVDFGLDKLFKQILLK